MVADGSLVTDPASPLVNRHLPDLRSKFVRGAASPSEVGVAGGSAAHSHTLAPAPVNTSDVAESEHRHQWASFAKSSNKWSTQSGNEEVALVSWGNGLDSEGSGIYPLAFTASTLADVPDTVYLTTTQQDGRTVHHHEVSFPPGTATASSQNEPPYVMLLKILRIK
jgi:hypothetical protein